MYKMSVHQINSISCFENIHNDEVFYPYRFHRHFVYVCIWIIEGEKGSEIARF